MTVRDCETWRGEGGGPAIGAGQLPGLDYWQDGEDSATAGVERGKGDEKKQLFRR